MVRVYWFDLYCVGEGFLCSSRDVYLSLSDCMADIYRAENLFNKDRAYHGKLHYCKLITTFAEKEEIENIMECNELGIEYCML